MSPDETLTGAAPGVAPVESAPADEGRSDAEDRNVFSPEILRSAPPRRRGVRVAIHMMQKNEDALLRPWLDYHAFLFGPDNLYVWDNGSTSEACRSLLADYATRGVNVSFARSTSVDFRRKGVIIGRKISRLDEVGGYDFHVPLDCDEFFALEVAPGEVRLDPTAIAEEFVRFWDTACTIGVNWSYYNLLGQKDWFWRTPHKKSVFRAGTFLKMDRGYHEGRTKTEGREDSRFVYLHYHHKPHAMLVEHSREKLRPFMDVDDPAVMQAKYDEGNRLARFIMEPEEAYLKRFSTEKALHIPRIEAFFDAIGTAAPFSTPQA